MTDDDAIAFVKRLDAAWMEGRFADIPGFFANNAVITFPDGAARIEGARAIAASYEKFMTGAIVRRFESSNFNAAIAGNTAVVEYQWDMAWDAEGMKHVAAGREALVLVEDDYGIRILWRLQIPAG
jgi:SnoaL-like domain